MIEYKISFDDIFEIYDQVKFVHHGHMYAGHIGKVHENAITVFATRVDIYDQRLGPSGKWFFRDQDFALFNIEWLDDHRGGDNSAIGVSPSWKDMSWITKHFEDHA